MARTKGKMGQKLDPMAVVDSHARVFGTKDLRVVDVSAFPFLPPPGHPQSTVCMFPLQIIRRIFTGQSIVLQVLLRKRYLN